MTTHELIERLKIFPPHFRVQMFQDGMGESEDFEADIAEVSNVPLEKVVLLEFSVPAGQRSGLLTTADLVTGGKPLPTDAGADSNYAPNAGKCRCGGLCDSGHPCPMAE